MSATCPICEKKVLARSQNEAWPFCSGRCKTIDLGKWMSGDYRVATNEQPDGSSNEETRFAPAAGNPKEIPS